MPFSFVLHYFSFHLTFVRTSAIINLSALFYASKRIEQLIKKEDNNA